MRGDGCGVDDGDEHWVMNNAGEDGVEEVQLDVVELESGPVKMGTELAWIMFSLMADAWLKRRITLGEPAKYRCHILIKTKKIYKCRLKRIIIFT